MISLIYPNKNLFSSQKLTSLTENIGRLALVLWKVVKPEKLETELRFKNTRINFLFSKQRSSFSLH